MGRVVISIDAELAWGFHDLASPPVDRIERARWGWDQLAELLERHRLPATWAIVGHLFLEGCDGRHRSHPSPAGWFRSERTRWADRPELRFAGELLDEVVSAGVAHDVGGHTFSHVVFGEPWVERDLARAELAATSEAMAGSVGVGPPRSFVFPRNSVGHRDVLADAGYLCYRGPPPWASGRLHGRLGKLVGSYLGEPGLVAPFVDDHGLVNVPASLYLFGFEGVYRSVAETIAADPIVRRARRGIDAAAAADDDRTFHVWLHPNNLVEERDVERLERIFSYLASRRDRGEVRVATMRGVAEQLRRRVDM